MPAFNPNRDFFAAYIVCALWSSTDNADDSGGEPLDRNYSHLDIAPETLERMRADCERFQSENVELLARYYDELPNGRDASGEWNPEAQSGHDFWLSRNGHGAGFFDRDVNEALRDALQDSARKFDEFDLYIGDDGKVWGA